MRRLTISLMSLAMVLPAMAQEFLGDVEPDEPEIRRYTVEIIIFKYAQDVSAGSEVFPRDEPETQARALDEEAIFVGELPEEPTREPRSFPDTELVLLSQADFQLDEIMGRMRRLDVYDPVMHFGWTQATWPEEQTMAIPLRHLARVPDGLDGELTLYLSRYLHLVVNLAIEAPKSMTFNQHEMERVGDTRTVGELLDEVNVQPATYYRIQENRILKNGELRYYDHPKFGVLAKVTRVEEEEPGEIELLGYGTE